MNIKIEKTCLMCTKKFMAVPKSLNKTCSTPCSRKYRIHTRSILHKTPAVKLWRAKYRSDPINKQKHIDANIKYYQKKKLEKEALV